MRRPTSAFAADPPESRATAAARRQRLPDLPRRSPSRPGSDTVFLSGALGVHCSTKMRRRAAPPPWGDTETQTVARAELDQGARSHDWVSPWATSIKMTIFLVGDPAKDNKMDFAGMMAGYKQFFGTADQPNIPIAQRLSGGRPRGAGASGRDRGHRRQIALISIDGEPRRPSETEGAAACRRQTALRVVSRGSAVCRLSRQRVGQCRCTTTAGCSRCCAWKVRRRA